MQLDILGLSFAFTLALAVMVVGLIGTIVPVMPGLGLIWLGALTYVLLEGFARLEPLTFAALTTLAVLGYGLHLWMAPAQARAGGASCWSLAAGMIGAVLGTFLIPIPIAGTLIGALVAVIGAELIRLRDWHRAARAGGGWLKGWLVSAVIDAAIGLGMIGLFVWRATSLMGR